VKLADPVAALAFVPAAIGFAFPAPDYYASLAKPGWAPPSWLFGPVSPAHCQIAP
jgi:tryptophan-rich sensory protein